MVMEPFVIGQKRFLADPRPSCLLVHEEDGHGSFSRAHSHGLEDQPTPPQYLKMIAIRLSGPVVSRHPHHS